MNRLLPALLLCLCLPIPSMQAYAQDNLSTVRFLDLTKEVEREQQQDLSGDADNQVLRLLRSLKENTRKVAPHAFTTERSNLVQIGSWGNYWKIGFGRKIELSNYDAQAFLYGEQIWNDLEDYSLLEQQRYSCDEDPANGCIRQSTTSDLEFTLSTLGIGGAFYYLHNKSGSLALGIEAPLFAIHQLRIESKKAGKNYRINGVSMLGLPLYRHSIITPIKVRYRPSNWFSMTFSVKYATMTAFQQNQDEYAEDVEGEWIDDCRSNNCTFASTTGSLGVEMVF